MLENADMNNASGYEDDCGNTSAEYLRRAVQACEAGDSVLGMHLYLAAFEKAQAGANSPDTAAVEGLKRAWSLACQNKERSLAEYIFEKLEPFLSSDEMAACADELQELALGKLEEFGLSRSDLEDMTNMISQDVLGSGVRLMKVERIPEPSLSESLAAAVSAAQGDNAEKREGRKKDASAQDRSPSAEDGEKRSSSGKQHAAASALCRAAEEAGIKMSSSMDRLTYDDLAGYGSAVKTMREFGFGLQEDPEFQKLVSLLNARHGLSRMPAVDTLLFRSPAREDANHFMAATLGELGLPALRMRMEENVQGMPILCVMAQTDNAPKLNAARSEFMGAAVLIIEDIDTWISPFADMGDDLSGFLFAQLSRGAREAVNLIRAAVDNPDVYVLATASDAVEIDPFFLDMLEPMSIIDIDLPTPEERVEIWMDIAREHPSLRAVNRSDLVRYSASMPRYDIYMAAREAIEEAYKESLVARKYVSVTSENLFEKLAAYQPLESDEYHALDDEVVKGFRADLERIDDLLK